ncbi:MAG: serpin family protein [Syntrophobacteraceae bacterium]
MSSLIVFKEGLTEHGPFILASGQREKALLMHRQGAYPYAELEGWQALELPYEGGRLTMLVLLPSSGSALADVETHLDAKSLDKISQALISRAVDVTFPKFEIRADHPFLFLIKHRETGLILFWGRLSSPKGTH